MYSVDFPAAQWATTPSDLNDESNVVIGLLSFDGVHSLKLSIPFGRLIGWPSVDENGIRTVTHTIDGVSAEYAFGYSQKGDYYILRNVSSPGPGTSFPGAQRQELRGTSLLASRQEITPNPVIKSLCFSMPGLCEWAGARTFKEEMILSDSRLESLSFQFRMEDVESIVLFQDNELRVAVEFSWKRKGGPASRYSFQFETDCFVKMEFSGNLPLLDDAMSNYLFPTADFLSFCMGFRHSIGRVWFITDDDVKVEYYAAMLGVTGLPSVTRTDEMPFPFATVQDRIGTMLTRWYGFDGYARNAATMVVALMDDWKMPFDLFFLASAQALEAASRIDVDDREISDEELADKLQAIKESNLSSKMKQWVKYKLGNAKWKSANRLADDLLDRLEPVTSYVVPDVDRFKKDHRVHRDAYTHRRSLDGDQELSREHLYWHTSAVGVLAYAAVALALGIEPEAFLERLTTSRFRWFGIRRARQLYAKEAIA